MFLCETCHAKTAQCFHAFSSYGPCEDCGVTGPTVECFSHKKRAPQATSGGPAALTLSQDALSVRL